jgi:hypothetical protein
VTHSQVKLIIQNRVEGRVNQIIGRTLMEKMEEIQLIGSSSPYESNQASPTGGRRPLHFKRDLMGLSLSYVNKLSLSSLQKPCNPSDQICINQFCTGITQTLAWHHIRQKLISRSIQNNIRLERPCYVSRVDHDRKIRSRKRKTYRKIFLCK